MSKKTKIIVFWEGFPVCGLLLHKVIKNYKDNVTVLATRPSVPFELLEDMLGKKIIWLKDPNDIWDRREEFNDAGLVIHTAWNHRGWLQFDKYVKRRNEAKVICVVDNNYKGNLRQFLGSLYYRVVKKRYFDGVFVPGRQGQKLMRFFGVPYNRIYLGNYGAYEKIYRRTGVWRNRSNEFLYVGQLNKRKSVDVILSSFDKYRHNGGTWNLRILGNGELRGLCKGDGVIYEGFAQPEMVAKKMNSAKVFLLISREDHWGTVVCEAAACGMNIITAKTVGSSDDIVRNNINGVVLDKIQENELIQAFNYYENSSDELMEYGSDVSVSIATGYNSSAYYAAFSKMVHDLL